MIDIKKAEEEFKRYTSNYDMNESHIERKVRHTFRVEELCRKIAFSIGMNEEEINLAKLIGLLHDIARFEQYTRYKTFSDIHSIDHGDFGVEILEEYNYMRRYIETDKYDDIIKIAIRNHNKYDIEENLGKENKLFCQIIRDADKLDIMYEATCEFWKDEEDKIIKQEISPKVIEQFTSKEVIDNKNSIKSIDKVIRVIAFIFDLNFKESFNIIKKNKYIDKIIDRFSFELEETKQQMGEIRKIANEYINNKLEEE